MMPRKFVDVYIEEYPLSNHLVKRIKYKDSNVLTEIYPVTIILDWLITFLLLTLRLIFNSLPNFLYHISFSLHHISRCGFNKNLDLIFFFRQM